MFSPGLSHFYTAHLGFLSQQWRLTDTSRRSEMSFFLQEESQSQGARSSSNLELRHLKRGGRALGPQQGDWDPALSRAKKYKWKVHERRGDIKGEGILGKCYKNKEREKLRATKEQQALFFWLLNFAGLNLFLLAPSKFSLPGNMNILRLYRLGRRILN